MRAFFANQELTPEELKQTTQLTGKLRNSCTKGEGTENQKKKITRIRNFDKWYDLQAYLCQFL